MSRHVLARAALAVSVAVAVAVASGCGDSKNKDPIVTSNQQALDAAAQQKLELLGQQKKTRELQAKLAAAEAAKERAQAEAEDADGAGGSGGTTSASGGIAKSFDALKSSVNGQIGVAYVTPSGDVATLGPLQSGSAWSTMKVPIAVAVSRATGGSNDAMRQAITASDNDSAQQMWRSLGSPSTAGEKTHAVLSDGGSGATQVQTQVTRSGFSSFGQTDWSLTNSARFAASLPCLNGAAPVVELMGQIAGDQQWGIGSVPGSAFKGGWGPQGSGGYLVRQLGIMSLPNGGKVPLAIATLPSNGDFGTGTTQLTQIAQWAAKNLKTGASC